MTQLNKIDIKSSKFDIELELNCDRMIIAGDSGTGKSHLASILRFISESELYQSQCKSNIDLSKVIVISSKNDLKAFNWNSRGRVVYIDRADILLEKSDFEKLNNSKNIFYICSRRSALNKDAYKVTLDSYVKLEHTYRSDKHYFRTKKLY